MNKKELIKSVVELLKENELRKPVTIPKQTFTISDNYGHSRTFTVKKRDKSEAYTAADVTRVIDACLNILKDQLRKGESISIYGIGELGVHYRKPRHIKSVDGTDVNVDGRYVPKFYFGNELRMCARVYGMSAEDRIAEPEPFYSDDDFLYDEEKE